jgi:hypothetical protein
MAGLVPATHEHLMDASLAQLRRWLRFSQTPAIMGPRDKPGDDGSKMVEPQT